MKENKSKKQEKEKCPLCQVPEETLKILKEKGKEKENSLTQKEKELKLKIRK